MGQIAEKTQPRLPFPVAHGPSCYMAWTFELHLLGRLEANVNATLKHLRAEELLDLPHGRPAAFEPGYDWSMRKTIESGICWRRIPKRQSVRLGVSRG